MSDPNVKTIRALYEAFGSGDIQFVLEQMDPEIEWREADSFIYADRNPYIGPEAVAQGVFARLGGEWDEFTATPDEVLNAGHTVVARGHYGGTYRKSGRQVRAQFAHFFTFRDGKIVKFQQYTDTARFREATAA